jgi:hypothetical protein
MNTELADFANVFHYHVMASNHLIQANFECLTILCCQCSLWTVAQGDEFTGSRDARVGCPAE